MAAPADVAEDVSKERRMGVPPDTPTRSGQRASPFAATAPPLGSGARGAPAVPTSFATRAADVTNAFGGPALARATQGALRTSAPAVARVGGRLGAPSPGVLGATRGPATKPPMGTAGARTGTGTRMPSGRAAAGTPVQPMRSLALGD